MAISVSWSPAASLSYDPDDPVTHALFSGIIDNETYLYEWVGYGYTPDQAHNHDGINSSLIGGVGVSAGDIVMVNAGSKTQAGSILTYTKLYEIGLNIGGELRFTFTLGQLQSSRYGYAEIRRYRGGAETVVGTEHSIEDNTLAVSEDISGWLPQDTVRLYVKTGPEASSQVTSIDDFKIKSDSYIAPYDVIVGAPY